MADSYWEFTPPLLKNGEFNGTLVRALSWCQERGIRAELNQFGSSLRVFRAADAIWFEQFLDAEAKRDRLWWDQFFRNEKVRFEEIRPDLTDQT